MKNKILKEIIINLIISTIVGILLFVINKYFSIYLGIEKLGLMKLFAQLMVYLNLVEIGLGPASAFALYKPLSQKNYEKISIVFNTISVLYNRIFWILLIVGLILNPIIPFMVESRIPKKEIYLYWSLYVLQTASSYKFIKYNILFIADQKFKYVKSVQGITKCFIQILQIIVIIKYNSFLFYILLLILENIVQYIFYKKHYNKFYKFIYFIEKKEKTIMRDLKNLFFHKIGGLVVFNTDLILISKFVSLEIVGIYASYQMIINLLVKGITIISSVLKPKIGKFIVENDKEEVFLYYKKLDIIFIFFGIFIVYCSKRLFNNFIILWLGPKFLLSELTLNLILINLFIKYLREMIDVFKEGNGFFNDIYLPITEALINLFTSLILVYYLGLNGVIIGTIISNVLIISILRPILVFKRCFDKDIKEYVKVYGNYLILLLISLFCLNIATKPFIRESINGWIDWIIYATTISGITGVVLFIVFLLNKEFRNIIKVYVLKKK